MDDGVEEASAAKDDEEDGNLGLQTTFTKVHRALDGKRIYLQVACVCVCVVWKCMYGSMCVWHVEVLCVCVLCGSSVCTYCVCVVCVCDHHTYYH